MIDSQVHGDSVRFVSPVDGLTAAFLIHIGCFPQIAFEVYH